MSDLISREELKKTAKRIASMPWGDEDGNRIEFKWTSEELEALIDKAPSASQWIPVTERLPEKGGWYFITYTNEFVKSTVSFALFIEADPNSKTSVGHFDGYISRSVTAWMPLPEPYGEANDD